MISQLKILCKVEDYCDIGLWEFALEEWKLLPAGDRSQPRALHLRLAISSGLEDWGQTALLAKSMLEIGVETESVYVLGATALCQQGHPLEAINFLQVGAQMLKAEPRYHYLLAKFSAAGGKWGHARAHLQSALRLNPAMRKAALEDESFSAIWSWL